MEVAGILESLPAEVERRLIEDTAKTLISIHKEEEPRKSVLDTNSINYQLYVLMVRLIIVCAFSQSVWRRLQRVFGCI